MKAKQALKLVGKSAFLVGKTDHEIDVDYWHWLTFVDEYKDVDYGVCKSELKTLTKRARNA